MSSLDIFLNRFITDEHNCNFFISFSSLFIIFSVMYLFIKLEISPLIEISFSSKYDVKNDEYLNILFLTKLTPFLMKPLINIFSSKSLILS